MHVDSTTHTEKANLQDAHVDVGYIVDDKKEHKYYQ